MIFLTSNGLSSQRLHSEVARQTAGMRSAVIITTACEYKAEDWHIPRLTEELKALDLSVDYFDFDTDDPKQLLSYDVIEINGGNPFYLLKAIRQTNSADILGKAAEEKLLIGISAGAVVLQKTIRLIASYTPEMNSNVGLDSLDALGIADIEILPHYHKFIGRFERFEERAAEYEQKYGCTVIRLDDGEGVKLCGGKSEIIGHL